MYPVRKFGKFLLLRLTLCQNVKPFANMFSLIGGRGANETFIHKDKLMFD